MDWTQGGRVYRVNSMLMLRYFFNLSNWKDGISDHELSKTIVETDVQGRSKIQF
jgi:hypothetical protein